MKNFLISLFLLASVAAQQTAQIREIKVPYMSVGELSATVLPVGTMAFAEGDPTRLYIGDGITPGGRRVSEPTPPWNHSATTNITLNGNYLSLGSGFVLHQLGGFAAVSGQGEIVASPGVSTWGDSLTPFVRITGGNTLGGISGFVWNPITFLFSATILDIDAGAPSIQWTNNLVTGVWATHSAAVTGPSAGAYTATFAIPVGQTTAFFRAVYPTGSPGKVELLANTEITGTLSVSGAITGSLNASNLAGSVTSAQLASAVTTDIAKGVTANGWGNHASAGYLTSVTLTNDFTLGFFPEPDANAIDWLLVGRATLVTSASPGAAYCRTTHTAETTYSLRKNGTGIGSVVFAASAATGTVTVTANTSFAIGDRIELVAPASPDATGADIQVLIRGALE